MASSPHCKDKSLPVAGSAQSLCIHHLPIPAGDLGCPFHRGGIVGPRGHGALRGAHAFAGDQSLWVTRRDLNAGMPSYRALCFQLSSTPAWSVCILVAPKPVESLCNLQVPGSVGLNPSPEQVFG